MEVGHNFCCNWCAFFVRLEDQFGLDCSDPGHIWFLHTLFLNDINADCNTFIQEWNSHPISGRDTNDMSPQVCSQCLFIPMDTQRCCRIYIFFGKLSLVFTTKTTVKGFTLTPFKHTMEQPESAFVDKLVKLVLVTHLKNTMMITQKQASSTKWSRTRTRMSDTIPFPLLITKYLQCHLST